MGYHNIQQLVILSDRSEAKGVEGPASAFVFAFAFRRFVSWRGW
jgi:hypothetical protein